MLAEVDQIGNQLQVVEDQAWKAQQRLALAKQSLRENKYRLHVARGNLRAAQKRLAARLYSLYVNGAPSAVDVIAGAHSLSQLIDRAESAQVLSDQDSALGTQAVKYEHSVQARERRLKTLEAQRAAAARELRAKTEEKQSELGREKQLLASIHLTISHLVAQEQARERAARAAALERLREQEAARRAAERAAAATAATAPTQAPTSAPTIVPPPVSIPHNWSSSAGNAPAWRTLPLS